ncbi:MAG: alanine racemase [Actinobacteria bacterium]|nr:MAG: alanine racemase [Actinomycetota bacterium]
MRPSWVEVDLAAVRSNVAAIADVVAPAALCAVVKADAYGHGDVPVAGAALDGGAQWLAVALVEEAARLREGGIDAPILLLSEPSPGDAAEVVALGVTPTAYRWSFATAVAVAAEAAGATPYEIHVKVDSGMHRVGARPEEALALVRRIADDRRLALAGIWTHFAVSEEDTDYTAGQLKVLHSLVDSLAAEGISAPWIHAANTAAALDMAPSRLSLVRVGLGMYGLRPAPAVGDGVDLRPAMRVVSHVSYLQRLSAGERPSYGRVRALAEESTIATIPIGYADGVARRLATVGGEVLIAGKRHPFAGNITMDQIVVDVGDDPVSVGDQVVLLGRQGDDAITAEEWADRLGTINYEIVCDFGPRLPRRYLGSAP